MAAPIPGPAPRPVPSWGFGFGKIVLGPFISAGMIAITCGVVFGPCAGELEALQGPGQPAVVVLSESRRFGKSTRGYAELETVDGISFSARFDPKHLATVRPGKRTRVWKTTINEGDRYPTVYVEAQRSDVIGSTEMGRAIGLYVILPLLAVLAVFGVWHDRRRHRLWTHGVAVEGTILGVSLPHVSYRFRSADGEIVEGRASCPKNELEAIGGLPAPGVAAWILHAPTAPRRSVLYSVDPSRRGPDLPPRAIASQPSAGATLR